MKKRIKLFEEYIQNINEGIFSQMYDFNEDYGIWDLMKTFEITEKDLPILFPDPEKYKKYVGDGPNDENIESFYIQTEVSPYNYSREYEYDGWNLSVEFEVFVWIEAFEGEDPKKWSEEKKEIVERIELVYKIKADEKAQKDEDLHNDILDYLGDY